MAKGISIKELKDPSLKDLTPQAIKKKYGADLYIHQGLGRHFLVKVARAGGKRPSLIALHL